MINIYKYVAYKYENKDPVYKVGIIFFLKFFLQKVLLMFAVIRILLRFWPNWGATAIWVF